MMGKKTLVRLFLGVMLSMTGAAFGQAATGVVRGVVTDPSGALVPQAEITVRNASGLSRTVKSNGTGSFEMPRMVPGRYTMSVAAKGFSSSQVDDVEVFGDKTTTENVKLEITVESEVQVTAESVQVSTSPDDNASALVIKGKTLDALSDDPDDLQNELTALAGPAAGPSGAQIYIDGFTGGQLPPKSSIREIRINRNPFSAQYDKLGYGRIEILTKPGTDKFHGSLMMNGNEKAFNSLNPFVTNEPSYYSTFFTGNASGALSKSASWFTSVFRRDNQSNSIITAQIPGTTSAGQSYSLAVSNPQSRLDISPRFDFQLGANNTLSVRYMYDRQKQTNSGVSGFALQSQAYDVLNHENTIQISDTQVLSQKVVNDSRFQYTAARNSQAASTTTPTVTVQGAFTGGGSNAGTVKDNQDRYEFQDYITAAEGLHALNFGTRLRLTHEVDSSTSGFNGNYIYQSLSAYAAGTPSEYDVTAGTPTAKVNLFDAAFFFQDDWSIKPNLTLSYGVRYEGQNRISDHADFAPRFAVSWAPGARNGKKASTVLRAGYGWFFDRFSSTYVLDAIHQNGINQQNYVVKNPTFTTNAPSASQLSALSTAAPTLYSVSPNLKASVNQQAAFGIDRSFGRIATLSATYINSRGVHQYMSDNVNAYVGYDATTGTGTRPNGINENIYQFQSAGQYSQNQLMLNYMVKAKKVSLFGFYMLGFAKSDTSGATYFSSNPTNPKADYGRATFDVRNRFVLGGNYQAPFGISLSPFLVANSGSPFNVTIGQDLNGDNQYNDRPSYATASSTSTMQTAYGDFDLNPSATATRIPYNLGTGPAQFSMNLRMSKTFGIGPRVEGGSGGGSQGGGPGGGGPGGGGPGGGGPGGGGPGGGGLGPGGLSGNGGPPRLDQLAPRRYSLTFSAMGRNVFNHVSLAAPVGVLSSPSFGQSRSIAGGFFGSAASNRSVDLQASFNF
ncbi:Carboxypeptidase regulatory-like domain-containing protein [Granulicella pectinivorans]|uniref:Carboxypeptidase regulatory-like domain-containing protein n=1 Tax=Granulicella pectinivorans TaxID=474950 RepID=A0A1I6M6B7_9BACT|nr:TonB-dependent receptor [Granulicella pectinivorans]SFS11158.1 Carboxypeptidase regulatory-like domain-containing protein [Granulicella pectinivorans]